MTATSPLLSIAPMIDWTYTHFRVWMRLLAPNVLLYTEMQTTGAIQFNPERALFFNQQEHPIAIQLGGSNKDHLAHAAKLSEQQGYDEVNLNLGCPSDKVIAGQFGACLMKEPQKVVECIREIKNTVQVPVSAKVRIGIDHQDSYEFFRDFVFRLIDAGCDKLIVHARKAWLHGLSPKQNRTIPPINYDYVYRIKQELPEIPIVINGNIVSYDAIALHLAQVDGVMIGRLACDNPYKIAKIHHDLYPNNALQKRSELLLLYLEYIKTINDCQRAFNLMLKPLLNLAHGLPYASEWKKALMNLMQTKNTDDLPSLYNTMTHIE
jgi:tRNA-dihydrouridine synthase A